MPHDAPPPAPRETDPEASAEPKRAWSKPVIKKMTYVYVTASGPILTDQATPTELPRYTPTSS